ncbi:hypothetical protein GGE24_004897 [Bradyrhizobium centrosematis]|nr:hypothetical protein [Bradyrhizobium centrosematis]MCS3775558.1 hypothetical protein [Bradyrhizobium centrosematis]
MRLPRFVRMTGTFEQVVHLNDEGTRDASVLV